MMHLNMFKRRSRISLAKRFRQYAYAFLILCAGLVFSLPALATTPVTQPPTEIRVHLGNADDALRFFPNTLELEAGKRYELLLDNPSPQKHYFTAKDFADASWTQKVEAGKLEVKGAIHEVELKPGGEAEWVLVPLKPGTYLLKCSIAGHSEAGMVGEIVVTE